jgi:hypothetical protein
MMIKVERKAQGIEYAHATIHLAETRDNWFSTILNTLLD